jgi:hypothetical protein
MSLYVFLICIRRKRDETVNEQQLLRRTKTRSNPNFIVMSVKIKI